MDRPAYQGANPISDIFSLKALKSTVENLPRAVKDPGDDEAQEQMLLAATLAGVGFGNAGVHLCHGMSYPISGQNPSGYAHPGYHAISVNEGERSNQGNGDGDGGGDGLKEQVRSSPLIPHGVSVAVTAPAVFRFTAASNPDRHLAAAECFGVDISQIKRESAGEVLSEALMKFLLELGDQPRGLRDLGFERKDLDALVEGTIPQKRVLMLAPSLERDDLEREREQLRGLFEEAMSF